MARLRRINSRIDVSALERTGWTWLPEVGYGFQVDMYYVFPEFQIEQLREAGFALVDLYNLRGQSVNPYDPGKDAFLHYLCRRIP